MKQFDKRLLTKQLNFN